MTEKTMTKKTKISITLSTPLLKALSESAKKQNRTLSNYIEYLILSTISNDDKK